VFCLVKPLLGWHINKAFSINDNNNDNTLDLILLLLMLAGQWCCCCCCCSFCQPIKLVNKAKIYTAINPPGVLFEEGAENHHLPTAEEMQAYRKLLSRMRKL